MKIRLEGCPCDYCEDKQEDGYGLLCDLSCGKYTAHSNYKAGYDCALKKVVKLLLKYKDINLEKEIPDDKTTVFFIPNDVLEALLKEVE